MDSKSAMRESNLTCATSPRFTYFETDQMETTEDMMDVSAADQLKPFPVVAMKLMDECKAEIPDTFRIIEMIECEPAIASKVLSVANSPLYGCTREIDSIPRAVLVLGARNISNFAVSCCAKEVFGSDSPNPIKMQLLEHCLGTAIVAKIVAGESGACDPSAAFLTGMIHDIGKLVFINNSPEKYESHKIELLQNSVGAEESLFGISHVELGQNYISKMGFPTEIADAVGNHHACCNQASNLNEIASISNRLAKLWQLGSPLCQTSTESMTPDDSALEPDNCDDLLPVFASLEKESRDNFESSRCVFLN